jgi:hypothetical protein
MGCSGTFKPSQVYNIHRCAVHDGRSVRAHAPSCCRYPKNFGIIKFREKKTRLLAVNLVCGGQTYPRHNSWPSRGDVKQPRPMWARVREPVDTFMGCCNFLPRRQPHSALNITSGIGGYQTKGDSQQRYQDDARMSGTCSHVTDGARDPCAKVCHDRQA